MRLMIDIPDKIYETVQNGTYCGTLYEELKNGTPLSESEDAISRQAVLEKAICVPIARVVTEDKVIYRKIVFVDEIENIPPVKPEQKLEKEPCEDCISRQAVLDLAKFDGRDGLGSIIHAFDVEQLPPVNPAEKPNKWIPVSERLPEKNMACLVTVGKFTLTQEAIYSNLMGTIDHRIFYQGYVGHDNFEDITEYVKAWMPLPLPYKASPTEAESED